MRVLLAQNMLYVPAHGGANKANRALLEGLAAAGHECTVVAPALGRHGPSTRAEFVAALAARGIARVAGGEQAEAFELGGVTVHAGMSPAELPRLLAARVEVVAPDAVLVSSEDPGQGLLAAALEAAPDRVVLLAQTTSTLPFGPDSFFASAARSELVRRVAGVVTPSRYLAGYVERHGGVRATALTPPVFSGAPYPDVGHLDGEFVTIVNPCAYKGVGIFAELAQRRAGVAFAAVPSWGTTQRDLAMLRALGNVTLLPATDDIDEVLARTRVLTVPSLWAEAFGLVAVEAMVRGIPVLASDVGGLTEAKLGVDHLLPVRPIRRFEQRLDERACPVADVPEQDTAPWLAALDDVLADRGRYEELSAASRAAAGAFAARATVERFSGYLEALPRRTAAPAPAAGGDTGGSAGLQARLAALSPDKRRLVELRLQQRRGQQRREHPGGGTTIPRRAGDGPAPLSFGQERLWLLQQVEPDNPFYNEHVTVRMRGYLDVGVLRACMAEIARRHDVLRTSIHERGGRPVQVVAPAVEVAIERASVEHLPVHEREAEAYRLARAAARRPFDLGQAPLARALLVRVSGDDHVLLLATHYIVGDHWAISVLARELSALYPALAAGEPSPLPELAISYADFATWQRARFDGGALDGQMGYWRSQLDGLPPALDLPTDRPRPARPSYRGGAVSAELPAALTASVDGLARREGTTPFVVLLAAFQALLHRYTAQDDLAVGSPVAGRNWAETEPLIGFFLNMLVLRSRIDAATTFVDLVDATRRTVRGALANQDIPFERLVDELGPGRDGSRIPLFQVAFTFQDIPMHTLDLPGIETDVTWFEIGVSKLDLDLYVERAGERLRAVLVYDSDLFDGPTAERALGHYRRLLDVLVAEPARPVAGADLLTPAERSATLVTANATASPFPADRCLHELFEARADEQPDAVAVSSGQQALTYGQLEGRANRLAHLLRAHGAGPGAFVGVCLERGPALAVALMAVSKAGAAYMPLDPFHPPDRWRYVLADAAPAALVTQAALARRLGALACPVVRLDADARTVDAQPDRRPAAAAGPDDLAYLIYTSGSTGRPKGVLLDHRGRVNNFTDFNRRFGIGRGDALLAVSSPAFDMSAYDVFGTLAAGATVVMPDPGMESYPEHLADLLRRERVTVWHSVPMLLSMLVDHLQDEASDAPAPPLRLALLGGDWIPVALPDRARERFPGLEVVSLGGATEVSMDSTIHEIGAVEETWTSIPYGTPMANQLAYVLDPHGNPLPAGVPGELHLGGVGVAWGYHGRARLSAEKFVPNPFARRGGERLYRTGDRARWRPDGTLELLGRIDFQINLSGHRVEPGEVEAAVASHPGVERAVVLARGRRDRQKLVAWFLPVAEPPAARELREHVAAALPDAMVPAAFVPLDALPLSPNGKVDRAALPDPPEPATSAGGAEPRTETERVLAAIYADLLGLDRPPLHDGFFELGGDSILAIQVVARARQAGVAITPKQLFVHQTVADLAAVAGVPGRQEPHSVTPVPELPAAALEDVRARYPDLQQLAAAGPMQATMLARQQDAPIPGLYTMAGTFVLPALLDAGVLAEAWRRLVARHEVLRTAFVDGGPAGGVQVVCGDVPVTVVEDDWRDASGAELPRRLKALLAEHRARGFDPARPPLFALHLVRLSDEASLFVRLNHYLIADGWSLSILFRELLATYGAVAAGTEPDLPPPRPYRDFVAWVAAQDEAAATAFWREQLAGCDGPSAVAALGGRHGASPGGFGRVAVTVDAGEADRLRSYARSHRLTLATLVQGAWATVLARRSGQADVTFGVTSSGRPPDLDGVEDMVGLLINTVPVRTRVEAGRPLAGWLRGLQHDRAAAAAFDHLPLARVAEAAGTGGRAVFDSLLVFDNYPVDDALRGLAGDLAPRHRIADAAFVASPTEFPLRVDVTDERSLRFQATFHVPTFAGPEVRAGLVELAAALGAFVTGDGAAWRAPAEHPTAVGSGD